MEPKAKAKTKRRAKKKATNRNMGKSQVVTGNHKLSGIQSQEIENIIRSEPDPNECTFWPEDKKLPLTVPQKVYVPCPKCRAVLLSKRVHGKAQACVKTYVKEDVIGYKCNNCNHHFKMAIEK